MDPKILERFDKLMRLASPDSGATEGERTNAALAAADLYSKHRLTVREREAEEDPTQRRRKQPARRRRSAVCFSQRSGPLWVMSVATSDVMCEDCGSVLYPGTNVWMKTDGSAFACRRIYT